MGSSQLYPSGDTKLAAISPKLLLDLYRCLDKVCPEQNVSYFKMLMEALPDDVQRHYKGRVKNATELLEILVSEDKDVAFLSQLLERSNIEDALGLLRPPEPLKIIEHPQSCGNVYEHERLRLECRATGFPVPHYQWYRGKEKLPDKTHPVLTIEELSLEDCGKYCCLVYHSIPSTKEKKHKWSTKATVTVVPRPQEYKQPRGPIRFVQQPADATVKVRSEKGLVYPVKALAIGPGEIKYKWYRNSELIKTPEAQGPDLSLEITGEEKEIKIQCQAYNEYEEVISTQATLKITKEMFYEAKEKVALLIGIKEYRSLPPLHAIRADVENLARKLTSLHFKVFTFIDLQLSQMRDVVRMFCDLLNQGVYAVFYFAGHGFQRDGQVYMLAWDAHTHSPISDCLCAEEVLVMIQQKDPALCFFILDVCREEQDPAEYEETKIFCPKARGNQCILYATCFGLNAYEDKHRGEGILVRYLSEAMDKDLDVDAMTHYVKRTFYEIGTDPLVNLGTTKQLAEVKSNLKQSRSLKDPVVTVGGDKAIRQKWEDAHHIGAMFSEHSPYILTVRKVGIQIKVWCVQEHSNILSMYIQVVHLGCANYVAVEIIKDSVPLGLAMSTTTSDDEEQGWGQQADRAADRPGFMKATFTDLQALQEGDELTPVLLVKFAAHTTSTQHTATGKHYTYTEAIRLGRPLCSALDIWTRKPPQLNGDRDAEEQSEGFHSSR